MNPQSPAQEPLKDKLFLVTGAARRIGRALAMAIARAGGDVIIHYGHTKQDAIAAQQEITTLGRRAWILQADLRQASEIGNLMSEAAQLGVLYGLVNSAAIFEKLSLDNTTLAAWENHMAVNLTAPYLLCQVFARQIPQTGEGRIVNILDWRALQPGGDHFPYTVSKAALAAMTRSLAAALAPKITVNGLALGAILPPSDRAVASDILDRVPAQRWGSLSEVGDALVFLLAGPTYITGEILHVDGGRHLG